MFFPYLCNLLKHNFLFFSFIHTVLAAHILTAYNLPLPSSLQHKPIHYEQVVQINDWSCGYNVLYNAARLEKRLGFNQKHADLNAFKAICAPYVSQCGTTPKCSSSNKMLDTLAGRLQLQPFSYLHVSKQRKVDYVSSKKVRVSYKCGASESEINRLFDEAFKKQTTQRMDHLKAHINAPQNKRAVVHFAGQVISRGTNHVILLSVVKDGTQKAMYISDNMNATIKESSEAKIYIDYIAKEFGISDMKQIARSSLVSADAHMENNYFAKKVKRLGFFAHRMRAVSRKIPGSGWFRRNSYKG